MDLLAGIHRRDCCVCVPLSKTIQDPAVEMCYTSHKTRQKSQKNHLQKQLGQECQAFAPCVHKKQDSRPLSFGWMPTFAMACVHCNHLRGKTATDFACVCRGVTSGVEIHVLRSRGNFCEQRAPETQANFGSSTMLRFVRFTFYHSTIHQNVRHLLCAFCMCIAMRTVCDSFVVQSFADIRCTQFFLGNK